MRRSPRVWIITGATALLFFLVGWLVPGMLGLETTQVRILRLAVFLLGLLATLLIFFWASSKWKALSKQESAAADDIDVTLSAAKTRLAAARGKAAAKFGGMPVILVAGPAGSAKTTIITRSGMEPELLAGEVYRGDAVMPTSSVNVWYAQDNLVVEAGGPVAGDAGRWQRLVRHMRPNRIAAAFSRRRQPARIAVVCFGCDELLKPGASESVPAAAQRLRTRLAEVSQQIGIRLPVYVLFTKADRLPYFEEYVRNITRDEARDVLGTTLTVPPEGAVGAYAEREARRLGGAFDVLFRGLASRRLDLLSRESQEGIRAGAYEFPREFRKVTDLATQFLLDLCRPSQLGLSPFLRGFYFTGVRPVYVHDVGAESQRAPEPSSQRAMDATGVFDPRMLHQQAAAPAAQPGSRKVPEWTFLERVFSDVVLRDDVARGITGGGTRVNFLRRALISGAAAACLLLATGFTWSFFANRGLLRSTQRAVEGARSLATVGPVPDLETLERLDSLRARAALLNEYAREGAPTGLRWMLYTGNRVQPQVRQLYFQKFAELQWQRTRSGLIAYLQGLPASPSETSTYDETYDALKAYIATTRRPDQSDREFMTPTLMTFWSTGINADPERSELARAQFDFFADELAIENPYEGMVDEALVDQTQRFLRGFAGADQFYRVLLAEAGDSVEPVRWSDPIVRNDAVVPGAFTRAGWDRAQATLADVPRLFDRDNWVVGETGIAAEDRDRLAQELKTRYTAEYLGHWMRFLQGARVAGFSSVQDAARGLAVLSTNQSPLMRLLSIVSDNTDVDTTLVGVAFQPVKDVVPPESTSPTQVGGQYLNTLAALEAALIQVTSSTGDARAQAMLQAGSSATQVRAEVTGLARGFSAEGDAREVGTAVASLLQGPALNTESLIRAAPAAEVNAKGGAFCAPFASFANRFPFNPGAGTEASLDDVVNALTPGTGALWMFQANNLQTLLVRQGASGTWGAQPGASPQPNPAFVTFFNRAAQVSNALFDADGGGLQVLFTLRIETSFEIPEVTITAGGRSHTFTRTQPSSPPFAWNGTATSARITARVENDDVVVFEKEPGPWAPFHMFYAAQMVSRGGGRYSVTWPIPGRQAAITGELSVEGGVPIFQSGYLSQLGQCVSRIAR